MYQLANDEGRFSIDDNGRITLAASLDREFTDSYNITVTVTDRGQPPRTATEHLFLEVLDVNDVDPQFERVMCMCVCACVCVCVCYTIHLFIHLFMCLGFLQFSYQ